VDDNILSIIADLKYLEEMKRMESLFSETKKGSLEMSNVVPMVD